MDPTLAPASSPDFGDGRGKNPFRVLQDIFANLPLCRFQRRESRLNVNEQGTLMGIVLESDLARLTSEIMRSSVESHGINLGYDDSGLSG